MRQSILVALVGATCLLFVSAALAIPPELPKEDPKGLCKEGGGTWTDCGSGCGPATCANPNPGPVCPAVCVPQCKCPKDVPLWDSTHGCISAEECDGGTDDGADDEGTDDGSMDDGTDDEGTTDEGADDEGTTDEGTDDEGTTDEGTDEDPKGLCKEDGGTWTDCGSGCGPATCANPNPGPDCPTVCVPQCKCPKEVPLWDSTHGCISAEECDGGTDDGADDEGTDDGSMDDGADDEGTTDEGTDAGDDGGADTAVATDGAAATDGGAGDDGAGSTDAAGGDKDSGGGCVAGSKGTGGGLWLLLLMVGALWMRRRKVNA